MSELNNIIAYRNSLDTKLKVARDFKLIHQSEAFKKVIMDGYCDEHLKELARKRIATTDENTYISLGKQIDAIAYFQQYLESHELSVESLTHALTDANQTLSQLQSKD